MTYGVYYIFCLILIATYSLAVSGKCLAKIKIFIFLLPPLFLSGNETETSQM